jgi:hypothetical protein
MISGLIWKRSYINLYITSKELMIKETTEIASSISFLDISLKGQFSKSLLSKDGDIINSFNTNCKLKHSV